MWLIGMACVFVDLLVIAFIVVDSWQRFSDYDMT